MRTEPKTDALTDSDLDKIANLLDNRLAPMATKVFVEELVKDEISGSEARIKGYINEGIETVMGGLDDLSKQMAEKEKVERLVEWAKKASDKIGVKINI